MIVKEGMGTRWGKREIQTGRNMLTNFSGV